MEKKFGKNWKGFLSLIENKNWFDVTFFLKVLMKEIFSMEIHSKNKENVYPFDCYLQKILSFETKKSRKFWKILTITQPKKQEMNKIFGGKNEKMLYFLKKSFSGFLKGKEKLFSIENKQENFCEIVFQKVQKKNRIFVLKFPFISNENKIYKKLFKKILKKSEIPGYVDSILKKKKFLKSPRFFLDKTGNKFIFSGFFKEKPRKKKPFSLLKKSSKNKPKFSKLKSFIHQKGFLNVSQKKSLGGNFMLKRTFTFCLESPTISFSWTSLVKFQKSLLVFFEKDHEKKNRNSLVLNFRSNFKKKIVLVGGISYEKLELIGKGGTGKVYKIIDPKKNLFALKKIKIHSFGIDNLHSCINEISILKVLRHRIRVVQLKNADISLRNSLIYMVFEYGECDLNRLIRQNPVSLSKDSFLRFLWRQVLETVQTIHQERIVHGDLKPANFLIVEGSMKIIDFGIAKPIQNDTTNITRTSQIGTLNYMPPESVLDIPSFCQKKRKFRLSRSADIWSLGCIFFQMAYGKTPFYHLTMMKKIQAIVSRSFEICFLPTKSPNIIDILKNCLQRNPDLRPSIPELLKHPFLTSENFRISLKKNPTEKS